MDVKSLAKSKRAHSQHHSRKPQHSNQKSKKVPEKPGTSEVRERTHQSVGVSALPSNWDRYEDEIDQLGDSASQPSDVVLPKSKGADYRHLISEAQSQSQTISSDGFPALDDVLPRDFFQGLGFMLSGRGEGIISRVEDDNFIVEDKTTAHQEASFLSLNLHALSEQLAKVDLSQRLYIEADLLPPELLTEGSNTSVSKEPDLVQTTRTTEAARRISEEQIFGDFPEKVKIADSNSEGTSFEKGNDHVDPTLFSQGLDFQFKSDSTSKQSGRSSQSRKLESNAQFNVDSILCSEKKPPRFEATAAQAELDMLLNDTTFLDSTSGFKSSNFSTDTKGTSTSLPQISKKGSVSSKTATITANFDDVLDDLLDETSNLKNQHGSSDPKPVGTIHHAPQSSSSSSSVTKSKVLDDIDSWLDTI